LGDPQLAGGFGEIQIGGNGRKVAQVTQFHAPTIPLRHRLAINEVLGFPPATELSCVKLLNFRELEQTFCQTNGPNARLGGA
jgi:hypothetical protein